MQDRFERFVVSITELHRYLQKLKELEMGQMDLKAGYTMCLYYLVPRGWCPASCRNINVPTAHCII